MNYACVCTVPLKSKLPASRSTELLHMLQECKWHLHMKKDMIGNLVLSGTVTQPKDWASTLS